MRRVESLLFLILSLCMIHFITLLVVIVMVKQKTKNIEKFIEPIQSQIGVYL
jgi:hypothetical protein